MSNWIPVTDRLPDDEDIVQSFAPEDGELVWPRYHEGGDWYYPDGGPSPPVTHWQPFPEPPSAAAEQTEE